MESVQQRLTCLLRWPLSFQNIVISLTQGWGLRRGEGGESFCVPACTLTGFGAGEALNPWTDSPAPNTVRSLRPGPHCCRRLLAASLFCQGYSSLPSPFLSYFLIFPSLLHLFPPPFHPFPLFLNPPPPYLVSTSLSISILSLLYFSLLGFVCWSFVSASTSLCLCLLLLLSLPSSLFPPSSLCLSLFSFLSLSNVISQSLETIPFHAQGAQWMKRPGPTRTAHEVSSCEGAS